MSADPLAIDLFCGLGGWTEGLLSEGYRVVGFDIERHVYGEQCYPAQLVLQDVLTIHGSQFKTAALIVASPPCQEFSYMAMPWSKAKQKLREYENGTRDTKQLTALFDACFRIQREACDAAGHHIPLVVENVRGAQRWVGRSRWNFGSFHLWGDVPALMPIARPAIKVPTMGDGWYPPDHPKHVTGLGFNTHADRMVRELGEGVKTGDRNKGRASGEHKWTTDFAEAGIKNSGGSWFGVEPTGKPGARNNARDRVVESNRRTDIGLAARFTSRDCGVEASGIKQGGDWFNSSEPSISRKTGSKSSARKHASAVIAKIPLVLSSHIGRVYRP